LRVLNEFGYQTKDDACYLQCFDARECRRLRDELGWQGRLVQLIGENHWGESMTDYDGIRTPDGLRTVSEYADGIGPAISQVISGVDAHGQTEVTPLVAEAHRLGMVVHPYTARADDLPDWANDWDTLLSALYRDAAVDGLFCDFPDHAVRIRDAVTP
jgi:glycerophosphoryl diester phosphodiesterase